MKFKGTPAQNIALHTLQSVGLSALVTLVVSLGQFVSLHGLDWQQLATFAAGGFLTSMSMMWKTLSTNPNTMQAILDTVGELKTLQTASPVTIHNNLPAPAVVQPAPEPPKPVQQFVPNLTATTTAVQPLPSQFVQFPYGPTSTFPQMPVVQP